MLRITQSVSAGAVEQYFREALDAGEYYGQKGESAGLWGGISAADLGLVGEVDKKAFRNLANGLHPTSGQQLTARLDEDRRPGYDFTFSVPKSASVLAALGTESDRTAVRAIFDWAVNETMKELESEMKARVREKGADHDRITGNMVWARFDHLVTRPVDGLPDPHLHAHVYAFNLTRDGERWKAGQFGDLKADGPYWEAIFENRVATELQKAGYGIRRTAKGWEVSGISDEVVELFSRRTAEIEETIRKEGKKLEARALSVMLETGKPYAQAYEQAKSEVGASTRDDKDQGMPYDEALRRWKEQLGADGLQAVRSTRGQTDQGVRTFDEAVKHAVADGFARESVLRERMLVAGILKAGVGGGLSLEQIREALRRPAFVSNEIEGKRYVTTTEVLSEEKRVVDLVRHGMGRHEKVGLDQAWAIRREWLSAEQKAAVFHLLNSPDFVTGIRGAAGTGKSTMLREALEAVEHCSGKRLYAFAPSAEAVGVLRQEGFENATTIASLLVSPERQAALRGNLLLIDETGLTSIKDMRRVLDITQEQGARVILCGDRNQHRAVERGDTLRILEKHAGLKSAQLVEIRRQQVQEYNEAVRDLHAGKAVEGFTKLERIGFIQEIEDLETRHAAILQSFLDLKELKHEDGRTHTVLIAAPTHAEIQEVTSRLRGALQERGIISAEETKVERLDSLDLTEAQKRDELAYRPGLVIEPHFQITGAKKSEQLEVVSAAKGTVKVRDGQGNERELRLEESEKWSLYERQAIGLAVGDQVRVTKNHLVATSQAGEDGKPVRKRLTNGDVLRVQRIDGSRIHLERNGKPEGILGASKGLHLTYGYVITSNAAQGKTVDWAIPSLPAHSLSVATRELFYVLCSRARYGCKVFTDSKTAAKEAIQLTDYRMSAHDLMKGDLGERVEALKARAQAREATLRAKRAQVKLSPSESMGLRQPQSGPLIEYVNLRAMNRRGLSPSVQQGLDRLRRWSREQASEAATNRRERIREVMQRRKRASITTIEKRRNPGMSR